MLKDEVNKGWQLPLPPDAAIELPGCEVAPLGMEIQNTIDERGRTQQKYRMTHDQTFLPSGEADRSVNDRVDKTKLTEMQFGKAFTRLIYYIAYLLLVYPDEKNYSLRWTGSPCTYESTSGLARRRSRARAWTDCYCSHYGSPLGGRPTRPNGAKSPRS